MKDINYTNVEQQIKKLKSQQLIINDYEYARTNLLLYGYSNLIKSYREPYIIRNDDTITYRSGVTFEQICSIYILDKNLRNAVMASMQDLEEHIKEASADVIAKSFGTKQDDYLKYSNYVNKKKRKERFTLPYILDTLKSTLNTDKNPIFHYHTKYGNVPPWILFKSIYFSTIVNFIDLFKDKEKKELVKHLYDSDELSLPIDSLQKLLIDTLYICLDYRNMAAHGGRIYNHNSKHRLHTEQIFGAEKHIRTRGFSQLIFLLSLFKYKNPYKSLRSALEKEITHHCNKFPQDVTYLGQILNINIIPKHIRYFTDNSNKYHLNPHCSGIKNAHAIEYEKAKNMGLVPCKRCNKRDK